MTSVSKHEIFAHMREMIVQADEDVAFCAAITFAASNLIAAASANAKDGQLRCLKSMLRSFEQHTRECFKNFQKDGIREATLPSHLH